MTVRESLAGFYSEPQIRYLPQVLEEIDNGQIIIPKFQRPLVWPKEMRLALLDSILEGIPIGTVMLWRTRSGEISVKERLGPFLLPRPDKSAPVRQYLLDGEQRLTTLYFALIGAQQSDRDSEETDEPPEAFQVYYDLRGKSFVTRDDLEAVLPHHLSLTDMLQGSRLVKFQRSLFSQRRTGKHGHERYADADDLVSLSDEVADAFRQYKFPTVPVTSENLELVTRTFQRVNSQHVTMSEVHMVNALTWSSSFDLFDRLQEMKQGSFAELGWGDIEDQTVLRVCKIALGVAVYDDDSEAVGVALKKQPDVLREVEAHICDAARFLRAKCSIRAPDLVPYTAQIVLLAAAFRERHEPDDDVLERLRDWLWFTTYTETFQRQMSESRFSQLLDDVRSLATGDMLVPPRGKVPAKRPLPRFDFRHARARGVALLMARYQPRPPSAPLKEVTQAHCSRLLAEHRNRAMAQLVTSTMAKKPAVSSSPGARVLVRPESVGAMRRLLSTEHPPGEFLASHVISPEAYRAFRDGDYETFVRRREDQLNRLEDEHFQVLLRHLYPTLGGKANL
ncbi:DUF262 domain-containing protein [Sorangium sp. So ce542]|uniref:DUF262 domain-containing protein n=1 Tax=Sorangium sp. So ce542 TaxID=3133316 RepID=UPI003F62DE47